MAANPRARSPRDPATGSNDAHLPGVPSGDAHHSELRHRHSGLDRTAIKGRRIWLPPGIGTRRGLRQGRAILKHFRPWSGTFAIEGRGTAAFDMAVESCPLREPRRRGRAKGNEHEEGHVCNCCRTRSASRQRLTGLRVGPFWVAPWISSARVRRRASLRRPAPLVGASVVVGTRLSLLRGAACGRPAGASRVSPAAGIPAPAAELLVLLSEPAGLLSLRPAVSGRLDDGCPTHDSAFTVGGSAE